MKFLENYAIEPMSNMVLLQRSESEEQSVGGILLPSSSQEKSMKATVLAVGPGLTTNTGVLVPMVVKPGDVVLIDKIGGLELVLEGEKVLVARETEIIAILRKK